MISRPRRVLLGLLVVAALTVAFIWKTADKPNGAAPSVPAAQLPPSNAAPVAASTPPPVGPVVAPKAEAPAMPVPPSPAPTPVAAVAPVQTPPAAASSVPPSVAMAAPSVDEVAATARMYAAHAPLRLPEVADPDSETNRRILQTMVEKALARTASPPASPTPNSTTSVPTP